MGLTDFFAEHEDALAAAFFIGMFIRLLKNDTRLPTLAARLRPALALFGGILLFFVERFALQKSWKAAIVEGLLAAFLPMGGDGVLKSILGRDVPLPNFIRKNDEALPHAEGPRSGSGP